MFCTVCTSQDSASGQFVKGREHQLSQTLINTMLIIGSVQHKSCMHVLSGHTSTAEQAQVSQLALQFQNAPVIDSLQRLDDHSLTWNGCAILMRRRALMWECLTGLTRSAASSSSTLQKSSRPVYRQVFSLETFFSVMVDGTTDSSVTEAEIIYIRYT